MGLFWLGIVCVCWVWVCLFVGVCFFLGGGGTVCSCCVWVCLFVGVWVCFGHFFVRYIFVFVEYFGLCWVQICFLLCTCVLFGYLYFTWIWACFCWVQGFFLGGGGVLLLKQKHCQLIIWFIHSLERNNPGMNSWKRTSVTLVTRHSA